MAQSVIRFSFFGNFENFNTANLENYMKLIEFFGKRGFRPSTANELQVLQTGQVKVLIMPCFSNENNTVVEFTSNRLNFQKSFNTANSIQQLIDGFAEEFYTIFTELIKTVLIVSNRLALNCEIIYKVSEDMPEGIEYFNDLTKKEVSLRNLGKKIIEGENINIIVEKTVSYENSYTKISYDINTAAENFALRFSGDKIKKYFDIFLIEAKELEKVLKNDK